MIRMPVARVWQVDELRLLSFQQRPQLCRCLFDPIAKVMVRASQKRYICDSKNSRRLLRFTFANGPCFLSRQIAQGEFSRGQKYCGHVVAAGGMKADGSAATDRLVVRMGGNNKNIHPTFPLSASTLLTQCERE
jgi:hypothetical protein